MENKTTELSYAWLGEALSGVLNLFQYRALSRHFLQCPQSGGQLLRLYRLVDSLYPKESSATTFGLQTLPKSLSRIELRSIVDTSGVEAAADHFGRV